MFEEFEIKVVIAIIAVLNVLFSSVLGLCGEYCFLNSLNLSGNKCHPARFLC